MNHPSRARVESLKRQYPPGARIELISMNDPYHPVPPGTKGTVIAVDDIGTIHTAWDNGQSLGLVYGEDSFKKLDEPARTPEMRQKAPSRKRKPHSHER